MAEEQTAEEGAEALADDASLLESMLAEAKIKPEDETYDVARRGIQAFVTEMLAPSRKGERVDKAVVDAMFSEIAQRMSAQINTILHHPALHLGTVQGLHLRQARVHLLHGRGHLSMSGQGLLGLLGRRHRESHVTPSLVNTKILPRN